MKWLLVKRIFDMYIFSYVIFLVSITMLVFIQYSPSFSGKIYSTNSYMFCNRDHHCMKSVSGGRRRGWPEKNDAYLNTM